MHNGFMAAIRDKEKAQVRMNYYSTKRLQKENEQRQNLMEQMQGNA